MGSVENLQPRQRGFTLVELAVVLTLIALIIGGVMIGRNIIRNSQLQSVLTDQATYEAAIQQFKTKYNYLPGDFPNATSYWGTDSGGCPSATANVVKKTATCDGNGDGQIDSQGAKPDEWFRAWQHLANAGFIPGSYTGAKAPSPPAAGLNVMAGMNLPPGRIDGSLYYVTYVSVVSGSVAWFSPIYAQFMVFTSNYLTNGPPLTPAEAKLLDAKADDGLPGTGRIMGSGSHCVTTYDPTTSVYFIGYSGGNACELYFKPAL